MWSDCPLRAQHPAGASANVRSDRAAVILSGFSRGAIGCNYLGLHNEEIAGLWLAFIRIATTMV